MYTISNMVLQSCINSFGTVTVAAWTAFGKVDGFYWMVSGAFGVSITTFVSQNFGARKYDRLKKGVMVCLGVTFGVTALISLLFCGAAPILLRMFTSDSAVIALGRHVMWFTVPFYVTFVCIEIFSGAVRGYRRLPQAHASYLQRRVCAAGAVGAAGPPAPQRAGDRAGELSHQLERHLHPLYHLLRPGELAAPWDPEGRP